MKQKIVVKLQFDLSDLVTHDGRDFDQQDSSELQDLLAIYVESLLDNADDDQQKLLQEALIDLGLSAKKIKHKAI